MTKKDFLRICHTEKSWGNQFLLSLYEEAIKPIVLAQLSPVTSVPAFKYFTAEAIYIPCFISVQLETQNEMIYLIFPISTSYITCIVGN